MGLVLLAARGGLAATASAEEAVAEKVMGRDDAPVTMIEYSSLGCPHCARFHHETLPRIKETYIDTGKVRLVFRDFPLGSVALAAAMVARCAVPQSYFGFVEVLFRTQPQWSQSSNPRTALMRVARMGGMSEKDFDTCLQNQRLLNSIQAVADTARQKYEINSTPSFIINGTKFSGAQPFANFQKVIDAALKKKS